MSGELSDAHTFGFDPESFFYPGETLQIQNHVNEIIELSIINAIVSLFSRVQGRYPEFFLNFIEK
jgi:hypothetical protein